MSDPTFPLDSQNDRVDATVDAAAVTYFKETLGAGSAVGTSTTKKAPQRVGTHVNGGAIGATDPVALAAGSKAGNVAPVALSSDGALSVPAYLDTPTGLTLVQGSGTLGAAAYAYRVSAISHYGESLACAESLVSIAATHGVVVSWAPVPGATGYRVYGRTSGAELLMATISEGATVTWTDDGSITPTGALPTVSTARRVSHVEGVAGGVPVPTSRAPIASTVLASAARTATPTVANQINASGKGIVLTVNVTVIGASTLTPTILGVDPVSGATYTILAGAAITTTGLYVFRVYPGLTAAANLVASDVLPATWGLTLVHSGAVTMTYSVGAVVIP
jgi:hypothetical protein